MLNTIIAPTTAVVKGPMLAHPARITGITEEAYAIATYNLAFEDETMRADYRFRAGQFNMLYLPGYRRSAHLAQFRSRPSADMLGHTIRYAGNVTRAISRLRVGQTVGVRGPYGSAWPIERLRGHDLCIVTGGIGLAPLRPVIYRGAAAAGRLWPRRPALRRSHPWRHALCQRI